MPPGGSDFMPIHERSRATSALGSLVAIALFSQLAALPGPPRTGDSRGGWRTGDGRPAPDTEYRKSTNGFLAWLLVTDDEDWASEWDTDPDHVPT